MSQKRVLVLFDVDGTLTLPRLPADPAMLTFLEKLRLHPQVSTGFVGGSDIVKISEQLGANCENCFDFSFSENGLVAKRNGAMIGSNSVLEHFGEEKIKTIINFALEYIAKLDIPVKRGTFVEFRTGMLNISPIGRNCSQQERIEFFEFDKQHHVREKMIEAFRKRFGDAGITYSIGGQISFDLFPTGWDKTYCLRFVEDDNFDEIHFFGDKTYKGGNDYEIYESPKTIGHSVTSPSDTMEQVKAVLASL